MKQERFDQIVEIDKFNPFHDNLGRFANKNGFSSYSANPKSKAGAMAIQRSHAGGHDRTLNVHRESKGESVGQNAKWLATGQKPKVPAATSRARYQQRKLEQQSSTTTTTTTKPKTQAASKPKTTQPTQPTNSKTTPQGSRNLSADVSGVTLSTSQKMAIKPAKYGGMGRTTTKKVRNDNYQDRIQGKDISKSFDEIKVSGCSRAIDKVAAAQGWNKGATVTNDLETFQKAAVKSGQMFFRSVNGGGGMTAENICKITMSDGNASLGGSGAQAYGGGMYLVGAKTTGMTGKALGSAINQSRSHSFSYGQTQMMATVHPSAKIATAKEANNMDLQFSKMSKADRSKFGNDVGAYIASKGYDGAQWHNRSDPYITMYNKSAMIFYGQTYNFR